jgi:hypothetical protein
MRRQETFCNVPGAKEWVPAPFFSVKESVPTSFLLRWCKIIKVVKLQRFCLEFRGCPVWTSAKVLEVFLSLPGKRRNITVNGPRSISVSYSSAVQRYTVQVTDGAVKFVNQQIIGLETSERNL